MCVHNVSAESIFLLSKSVHIHHKYHNGRSHCSLGRVSRERFQTRFLNKKRNFFSKFCISCVIFPIRLGYPVLHFLVLVEPLIGCIYGFTLTLDLGPPRKQIEEKRKENNSENKIENLFC